MKSKLKSNRIRSNKATLLLIVLITSLILGMAESNYLHAQVSIEKNLITTVNKTKNDKKTSTTYCYLDKSSAKVRYKGAKKSGGKFFAESKKDKACAAVKTLKGKLSLSKLSSPLEGGTNSSSFQSSISSVSGTPPLLIEVLGGTPPVEELFYPDSTVQDIIDGVASPQQCGDFFGSGQDGGASGLAAGYTLQGVAYSYQNIAQAGTSTCYLKNFPTEDNLADEAITVLDGSLPPGGIENIFTPGNSIRRVRVSISGGGEEGPGGDIIILVPSSASNLNKGDAYNTTLVFCAPDNEGVENVEKMRIKLSGEFTGTSLGSSGGGGSFESKFTGFMRLIDGRLVFDESKDRTATIEFLADENSNFKSKLLLTSDGKMRSWQRDVFDDSLRKSFSVVGLSGSGFADLRLTEGAYKESGDFGDREPTAFEYRDTYYSAAPNSALIDELELVDFDDAFFDSAASPGADLDDYVVFCSGATDITIGLDMSHSNMVAVAEICEGERVDGGDFVSQSSLIQSAMEHYSSTCEE
jgi:hypothetical protein